jgi:hypothetical protein
MTEFNTLLTNAFFTAYINGRLDPITNFPSQNQREVIQDAILKHFAVVLSATAGILALRSDTWNKERRRLTRTGALAAALLLATFGVGAGKELLSAHKAETITLQATTEKAETAKQRLALETRLTAQNKSLQARLDEAKQDRERAMKQVGGLNAQLAALRKAQDAPYFKNTTAHANLRWIFQLDAGARATYEHHKRQGRSFWEAAIITQSHNRPAQSTIQSFGAVYTYRYLRELGDTSCA